MIQKVKFSHSFNNCKKVIFFKLQKGGSKHDKSLNKVKFYGKVNISIFTFPWDFPGNVHGMDNGIFHFQAMFMGHFQDISRQYPWDFPGNSTGVDCHFLLQWIFPTQGLNPGLPHCIEMLYSLRHQGSLNISIWIESK